MGRNSHNISDAASPNMSLAPPELHDEPVLVTGGEAAAATPAGKNLVSLSDFDMIKVIGRGSYAKVLMVELRSTKRIYAMKVIKKELVTSTDKTDKVRIPSKKKILVSEELIFTPNPFSSVSRNSNSRVSGVEIDSIIFLVICL